MFMYLMIHIISVFKGKTVLACEVVDTCPLHSHDSSNVDGHRLLCMCCSLHTPEVTVNV